MKVNHRDRQQGEGNLWAIFIRGLMEVSDELCVCVCFTLIYTHLTHLSHCISFCACAAVMHMLQLSMWPCDCVCYWFVCMIHKLTVCAGGVADSDREAGHWVMEFVPAESASH